MTQQGKRLESLRSWGNVPDANYNEAIVAAGRVAGGVGPSTVDASGAEMAIHRAIGAKGQTDLQDLRANTALRLGASNWASVGELSTGEAQLPSSGFDFVGPPWTGDGKPPNSAQTAFDGPFEQLNVVIGMRGVDSLSYAPHAIQAVWSEPVNLIAYSTDITQSASGTGTVNPNAVNGADVLRDDGGRETQRFNVQASQRYYFEIEVGKGTGNFPFRASALTGWEGGTYAGGNFDLTTGAFSNTGGGNYSVVDLGDRWRIRFDATSDSTRVDGSISFNDNSFTGAGARGTVVLYIWGCSAGYSDTLQTTQAVGALDNWTQTGDLAAAFYLTIRGRTVYRLDNSAGVAQAQVAAVGAAGAAVPHTKSVWISTDGADFAESVFTLTPSVGGRFTITAEAGEVVDFYEPQWCEGPQVFDLKTEGAERYLVRNERGVGRLSEPDIENKCQNYSIAPTDATNVQDTVNTTTIAVARGSLPAAVQSDLDLADPDGTVMAMYQTTFTSTARVYVVGPTGNTNEHFVGARLYVDTATSVSVGIENQNIAPSTQTQVLEYVGGKGTPLAAGDRFSIEATSGVVYWTTNEMYEDSRRRSHIPVGGSNRTRGADKPVAATDDLGIDRRRNSVPNSSSLTLSTANGWVANEISPGVVEFSGTTTGAMTVETHTLTDIAAALGQTWFHAWSVELVAGDLTNVTDIDLRIREATGGAPLGTPTALPIENLLSGELRRFATSRTLNQATVSNVQGDIQLTGSGVVSFTLRFSVDNMQNSAELLPDLETTGTAIEYVQWVDGLTVVDVWDTFAITVDFDRWLSLNDGQASEDNEIRTLNSSGASLTEGYFSYAKDGVGDLTGLPSSDATGLTTFQAAFDVGNIEYWQDGTGSGPKTITNPLPNSINTAVLGSNVQPAKPVRDGVQKRLAFYSYRASGAL